MKYKEWLYEWLNNYIKFNVKMRTFIRYKEIVKNHICPELGDLNVNEISTFKLQKFISRLLLSGNLVTGNGLSSSAVNSIITVIQNSLSTALSVGIINVNPAIKLKRPKMTEKRVECFSIAEQKKIERGVLIDKCENMFGIIICLYTGLRLGELLSLEWQDIDLKNGILFVTKTCYYCKNVDGKYSRIVDVPKTLSSKRMIPIPKQIVSLLKDKKKNSKSNLVIVNSNKPMLVRTYQRNYSKLLKKLNIEYRCFHSLRHTFATRALECGMDVKTLSEILGHKNSQITLNRYVHSFMEHKKAMMNKIGKLFYEANEYI